MIRLLTQYPNWVRRHDMARLLLLSLLVGIMAGFGTLVFNFVIGSSVEFYSSLVVAQALLAPPFAAVPLSKRP